LQLPVTELRILGADGSPSLEPRQQAPDPAGFTRIRLSLSKPVPAPPRRLKPPPARPEIATTWVPAGQVRLDAAPAAPPVEGGSVRLTFHAAVPGTPSASAGRFPEDSMPATPDRPAGYRDQPAARASAGWALNPLRAGGSWQGR